MANTTYRVAAKKGLEEFVKITARNHSIIVDEPVEKGGTNTGMNPPELLLSSLGACMALTLSIYSEAMGIKVDGIEIAVEGDLDSAGMKGSARVRPGFNAIRMDIKAKTNVPPETFRQVVDLAVLRCPVEDSVGKGVEIEEPTLTVENLDTK